MKYTNFLSYKDIQHYEELNILKRYANQYIKDRDNVLSIDHISPRNGKLTCGLDTRHNLVLLSRKRNQLKANLINLELERAYLMAYDKGIEARIIADSVNPFGSRFTTFLIKLPRTLLAQLNTHRQLTRNCASARAIPSKKYRENITQNPYIPTFTKNQRGMQGILDGFTSNDLKDLEEYWLDLIEYIASESEFLENRFKIHKQELNRILEPFAYIDVLLSGTEWGNFFKLRVAHDAQPDFSTMAAYMQELYDTNVPEPLRVGEWHLPFSEFFDPSLDLEGKIKVCTARCARLSYQTHEGEFSLEKDLGLFTDLITDIHLSPLEHIALAVDNGHVEGNSILQYIDPKLHKFLYFERDKGYYVYTRQYAGFYTARAQYEDGDIWQNLQ
jgi:thymidylate synthase ThyX